MDQEDPALPFFPDGKVDLYSILRVRKDATAEEIKKAYKKLALTFHPDKVLSNANKQETIAQFQKIGFSYSVLSDPGRRNKYDSTGSTRELGLGEGQDFDWNEYLKTLWTGEVSQKTLEEFKITYQNSDDERQDIVEAYQSSEGDLQGLFAAVPCSEFLADEERIIAIVNQAIEQGHLQATPSWTKSSKDKARARLRQKAQDEAWQAEKLAKELGVYDDLFGTGAAAANKKKASKGNKEDEGEEDLSVLQALMQRKQQSRAAALDDMIAKLECKGGNKETRPSDQEFDRIQAEMMARKREGLPHGTNKAKKPKK